MVQGEDFSPKTKVPLAIVAVEEDELSLSISSDAATGKMSPPLVAEEVEEPKNTPKPISPTQDARCRTPVGGEGLKKVKSILKRDSSYQSVASASVSNADSKNMNSTTSSSNMRRNISNVSFKSVDIREYDRTMGDNPSCTYGPPVSLDWGYSAEQHLALDDYEKHRGMRRNRYNMRLPARTRESFVKLNLGYSDEEVSAVTKDIKKVQRSRSVNDVLSTFWRVEDMCQSAKRKIARKLKKDKATRPLSAYEMSVELEISRSLSRSESLSDLGRKSIRRSRGSLDNSPLSSARSLKPSLSSPQIPPQGSRTSPMDKSLGASNYSRRSLGSSGSSHEPTLQF